MKSLIEQLQNTPLFAEVADDDLAALLETMHRQAVAAGTVLFRVGDAGEALYIVMAGRVRIYTEDEQGHELTLMHYGPAQIFGEFSLLDGKPRSASASAEEALEVLTLQRDEFMRFLEQRPQVSLAMMQTLAYRARYTTQYVEEVIKWAKHLASGNYQQAIEELKQSESDNDIQELVTAFLEMARSVQQREDKLKQELHRLQIKIDEDRRTKQVQEITETDFFFALKERAQQMRNEVAQTHSRHRDEISDDASKSS